MHVSLCAGYPLKNYLYTFYSAWELLAPPRWTLINVDDVPRETRSSTFRYVGGFRRPETWSCDETRSLVRFLGDARARASTRPRNLDGRSKRSATETEFRKYKVFGDRNEQRNRPRR